MEMKNKILKKSLTLVIVLLFIGLTLIPIIDAQSIDIKESFYLENYNFEKDPEKDINKVIFDDINEGEFVPGEIILKFNNEIKITPKMNEDYVSVGINTVDILNKKYCVKTVDRISKAQNSFLENVYVLTVSDDSDILSIVDEYERNSNIEYAEPNYIYHTYDVPNDPNFYYQWALNQSSDHDIDASEAWEIETGDEDIVIAVIDTGVDYTHPDLKDNIWINEDEIPGNMRDDDHNGYINDVYGWDFYNDDNDPIDDHSHGTHCAGIASAVTNNNIGIAGVCWNCKIMSLKFLSSSGNGSTEDGVNAIIYAANNGADVISMSFGGSLPSAPMLTAIKYAHMRGVVLVAAAGNDCTDKEKYPAAYKEVIAVAATDQNDYRAYFSNYGNWVDVAAPGVDILSTIMDEKYERYSGTSMACPHVSGLAALILSKKKGLGPDKVRTIIEYSVDRLDPFDLPIRRGRINAEKAIQRVAGSATAILLRPYHGEEVKGVIDIKGTANGKNFQYCTIEYTKGTEIGAPYWIEIYNSNLPKQKEKLCSLDTTELNEGLYTIRLRVICKDVVYDDTIWIIINNKINTFYVDDDGGPGIDQTSIRWGIYDAGEGDSVYVYNGTYKEDLRIYKAIKLIGQNKVTTIINGTGQRDVIYVSANDASISGFTIQNSGPHKGIFFYKAKGNTLSNNIITRNWIGIKLSYSSDNTIQDNIIINNVWFGVLLTRWNIGNKILYNNFIKDFPFLYIHAYFRNSYLTQWKGNYWDNWIGLKIQLLRFKPKRIPGKFLDFFPDTKPPMLEEIFHFRLTIRANFDWHPALEPHKI